MASSESSGEFVKATLFSEEVDEESRNNNFMGADCSD